MSQTSEEFNHAITNGCTTFTAVTCGFCGINHLCDPKNGGIYEDGEYEKLKAFPKTLISEIPIEYGTLDGGVFVPECECNAGAQYQNFLLNNREAVARFYRAMQLRTEKLVGEFGEAAEAGEKVEPIKMQ